MFWFEKGVNKITPFYAKKVNKTTPLLRQKSEQDHSALTPKKSK